MQPFLQGPTGDELVASIRAAHAAPDADELFPEYRSPARGPMLYLSGAVQPDLPAMMTPHMGNRVPAGQMWGADNGRFARPDRYTDEGFLSWLTGHTEDERARCLFATAPDVVGDAAATLELSAPMLPKIRAAGYPAALVAQDGLEALPIPWGTFDVLFVGGSTEWKLSPAAWAIVAEARRRGVWVHVGRVNSARRFRACLEAGVNSVDGTFLAFGPKVNRPRLDSWLDEAAQAAAKAALS